MECPSGIETRNSHGKSEEVASCMHRNLLIVSCSILEETEMQDAPECRRKENVSINFIPLNWFLRYAAILSLHIISSQRIGIAFQIIILFLVESRFEVSSDNFRSFLKNSVNLSAIFQFALLLSIVKLSMGQEPTFSIEFDAALVAKVLLCFLNFHVVSSNFIISNSISSKSLRTLNEPTRV